VAARIGPNHENGVITSSLPCRPSLETKAGPIRIAIAGGHPVIRGVVRLACASLANTVVVAEVAQMAEVQAIAGSSPDLLVLDLDLADGDGLDALRVLRAGGFTADVLAITERTDGAVVLEALKLNVRGYVNKSDDLRFIAPAIQAVVSGQRLIAEDLERSAVAALGRLAKQARDSSEMSAKMTARERQILAMVSDGLTMQQIGRRLTISPRTVETHVGKLYRKLGVRTRVEAVSKAASLGLIDLQ
jgi:DNA-binding NarL/FixJ family response regulator